MKKSQLGRNVKGKRCKNKSERPPKILNVKGRDGWLLETNKRATRVPINGGVRVKETGRQDETSAEQIEEPSTGIGAVDVLQTTDRGRVYPGGIM